MPAQQSSLEVALAVLECLVKDHGAVVTEADVRPDGLGSFTLRISMPPPSVDLAVEKAG